jgi:uncharacterized membrane protein YeaQ/YmgE (transglycosylase-associated protein family)
VIVLLVFVFVALFVVLPLTGLALWALVTTAIVGLVMGALGRLVIPGSQPIGLLATVLLGLVGAIVGSFAAHLAHLHRPVTLLLEIAASAVLVALYSARTRRAMVTGRGTRDQIR